MVKCETKEELILFLIVCVTDTYFNMVHLIFSFSDTPYTLYKSVGTLMVWNSNVSLTQSVSTLFIIQRLNFTTNKEDVKVYDAAWLFGKCFNPLNVYSDFLKLYKYVDLNYINVNPTANDMELKA